MFWLRWILYCSPLGLVFAGAWLFRSVAEFHFLRESDAIVHAIDGPVGYLSPLTPADGIEGEIAGLLFEPLLRRDETLSLRPNLLERWSARTVVTVRCESEEAAGEAEARVLAGEAPAKGPRPLVVERDGTVLTAAYDGLAGDPAAGLLGSLPPGLLGDYELVRIAAAHSIAGLVEGWLAVATERSQVRMIDYEGDRVANLFVSGDPEGLLRELRLYLDSNRSTAPSLERAGRRCHTVVREMSLELRPDAVWHDGQPFTAEDVAFSFRFLTRPESPRPLAADFDFVDSLAVAGRHRLRVSLREAPATMLESWEKLPLFPAHLLAGTNGAEGLAGFLVDPVGLGPYRLERRREDGGVELVAHEAWHRGAPPEKRRRYRPVASLEALLLGLRGATIDALEPDARFLEWSRRNPGAVETLRDAPRFQHLVVWNLERAPLDRAEVRQALARAYDPAATLREGGRAYEVPVQGLFLPGLPFVAWPMLLPLHDPRGAENLLERAGYPRDEATGMRRDAGGGPLAFSLAVNGANPEHVRLAEVLSEQWAAVGVEAAVVALPWEELLGRRLPARDFDAVLISRELSAGRDLRQVWHSAAAAPGGGNLGGLRDPAIDGLLERLRGEEDPARVTELVAALHRGMAERQPCLFLCDSGRVVTLRAGALELRPPGGGAARPIEAGRGGLAAGRPWWTKPTGP